MVTAKKAKSVWGHSGNENHRWVKLFAFCGLSTDTKPIGVFDSAMIGNGSVFKEIDTGDTYTYDGENSTWRKTAGGSSGDGWDADGDGIPDEMANDEDMEDLINNLNDL